MADPVQRIRWGVPAGEAQVYEQTDFRAGGRERYRCDPAATFEFHRVLDYVHMVPQQLIVYAKTMRIGEQVLPAALLTWELEAPGQGTLVQLTTSQMTSVIGQDMIDGHRNGHSKAHEQLALHVAGDAIQG